MNSLSDYLLVYGGLFVTVALMGLGTFAMIHADEAKGRRREQELKKRTSPDA